MTQPILKQYKGNCHCGLFKFSVSMPEVQDVKTCICAICLRKAYLWIVLAEADLVWDIDSQGEGNDLSVYAFGEREMDHKFCPKCGSAVLGHINAADPLESLALNARMLSSLTSSLSTIARIPIPKIPPPFHPPTFPNPPPSANSAEGDDVLDKKIYNGCCHCGAVSYSLLSVPLNQRKVISCNCSLCSRNDELYIYPKASEVAVSGIENLIGYPFLSPESLHSFCNICGVSVLVQVLEEGQDLMPLNIRTLVPSVDLGELKVVKYDGWSQGKEYVVK